jgi:feruloyl-CoA synthase
MSPYVQDVVITGLNEEYLGALIIPDLKACGEKLELDGKPTFESLATDTRLRELLREKLQAHAAQHSTSSTRIVRAMLLPSAPSLDAGEITDKGSINQRAVLECRQDLVLTLYGSKPASEVIVIR